MRPTRLNPRLQFEVNNREIFVEWIEDKNLGGRQIPVITVGGQGLLQTKGWYPINILKGADGRWISSIVDQPCRWVPGWSYSINGKDGARRIFKQSMLVL